MTWSYNPNLTSDLDLVRFLIGDTDTNDQLMQDEEISYLLGRHGSPDVAAMYACRATAAKFARLADKAIGEVRISLSQKAQAYRELAKDIERLAYQGISKADYTIEGDARFSRDIMEHK